MTNLKAFKGTGGDFKPRVGNYAIAAKRLNESVDWDGLTAEEASRKYPDEFKKYLFLEIKTLGRLDIEEADVEDVFELFSLIIQTLQYITPRDLLQMFPPEKEYDGLQYQAKDYFTTMGAIRKLEMDKSLGNEDTVLSLLFGYQNWDINHFMVNWMTAVSRMNRVYGGRSLAEEFFGTDAGGEADEEG